MFVGAGLRLSRRASEQVELARLSSATQDASRPDGLNFMQAVMVRSWGQSR